MTDKQIKERILEKLEPAVRSQYLAAISRYDKQLTPREIKIRRKIRDGIFGILPDKWADNIIDSYLKRKGLKKYHGLYVGDDSKKNP